MPRPTPLLGLVTAVGPALEPLDETLRSASLGGREGVDLSRYLLVCVGVIALVGLVGWGVRRLFGRHL